MSHHPEQAVKAAASRAQPRQHKAIDNAVRGHSGRRVRTRSLVGVEELPLDCVHPLSLGHAVAIAAAGCPSRLYSLQVSRPIGRMHPRLWDKVVRHGLAVEVVAFAWPSQLLLEAACALATAEAVLVSGVHIGAADLTQHGRGRRVVWQGQSLGCKPREKVLVGPVAHRSFSTSARSRLALQRLSGSLPVSSRYWPTRDNSTSGWSSCC